ncbi:MAG: prefoldin subunit [Candidatus Hodarchaeota archaeon]
MTINYDQLDEETKKKIQNLSALSQSLEFLTQQKIQLDATLRETELAIESLVEATPDTVVYKNIGGIMVRSTRDKLLDDKKSLKVTIEMRLKTLQQKLERTKSSLESLQKSLQADLQNK